MKDLMQMTNEDIWKELKGAISMHLYKQYPKTLRMRNLIANHREDRFVGVFVDFEAHCYEARLEKEK